MAATLPAVLAALRQLARLPLPPVSHQLQLLCCVRLVPMGMLMLLAESPAGWRYLDLVQRWLVRQPAFCCLPDIGSSLPLAHVGLAVSQESAGTRSHAAAVHARVHGLLDEIIKRRALA